MIAVFNYLVINTHFEADTVLFQYRTRISKRTCENYIVWQNKKKYFGVIKRHICRL